MKTSMIGRGAGWRGMAPGLMLALVLAVTFALRAESATWYVATNGSDSVNFGTNGWGDAYLTVSNAVAKAQANDTVLVSNGVYTITAELLITNGITLTGFGGSSNTFLRGGYPASTNRVLTLSNATAVVEGFTITNGFLNAWIQYAGAGVFMTAGTLRNSVIAGNSSVDGNHTSGGGAYISGGLISNCVIRGNYARCGHNRATYGGGVYATGGALVNCRFEKNQAVGSNTGHGSGCHGGGLYMTAGSAWNCLFTSNRVQRTISGGDWTASLGRGGGVYLTGGALVNCTMADNVCVSNNFSGGTGAGVYQQGGGVTNVIAYFNTVAGAANDFYAGGGTVTYSCAPELTTGTGNRTEDPLFVARTNLDYHLTKPSPCVDTGTNSVGLTTDLDGNPRPVDGDKSGVAQPDMGCYEYQANEFACDFATTNARVGLNALSNVVFTAAVDGTGSATNIVYYWWTFGAGTTPQEGPNLAMVSNTFLYGRYDVSLTVSNELGQVTSAAKVDYIRVVAENAFVSTNGTGQYPYETWAKATTNPVLALSALSLAVGSGGAATGDLWISNGVFDVTAELALNGPYRLHGMNGASNTVLRRNATPKYRVLSLTHAAALAEGLTITNGYNEADGAVSGHGGGVYMTNGILRDCILIGNRHAPAPGLGEARGGGVCLMGGLVSNCVVRNNRAYASNWNAGKGGGVYAGGGTVRECRIEGNDAQGCGGSYPGNAYGGGLYLSNSASAYNCLIRTNRLQRYSTEEKGGGVYVAGGTLLHCTVVENLGVMGMSGTAGGGIFQAGGGVTNCIVYFNLSTNLASDFGSSGGNEAYSCAPELTTGTGNRSEDPLFVARTNLDYHLTRSSPCLEGGTNVSSLAVDLDGNPRLVDGDKSGVVQPDMGCYEYQGGEFACDFATTNARIGLNALSNVVFTASADGIGSATNIVNYWWDFGAGTTPQTGPGLAVVSNTFLCGRYDVSLTVSNALGQVTSASKADYIRVVAENAYVSTNGTGQYPYETWAKATTNPVLALSTLSLAVGSAGATAGDLWISNGVFGVTAELALSGPFRLHGMNGASNTVLRRSGAAYYRVLNLTHAGALAEGVTVTNGYVNIDDATQGGGGIWMTNGIVRNCVIAGNTRAPGGVDGQGGGVYMTGGVLSNCIVRGNYAIGGYFKHGYGGGVHAGGGTIRECRIEGNRLVGYFDNSYGGDAYGGGLYMTGSPEAWNSLIASNSLQRATNSSSAGTIERGGGVFVNGGTLLNCTVVDNRGVRGTITAGAGGGVYQAGGTVRNCIVYANLSSNTANDFVFTAGARDYSCAPELTTGVNNNTSADPQFMRRAGADYYRLRFGSPCMNSGTNLAWMTNAVDFEGYARILGGRVNMGAYEYVLPMGTGFIFR